MQKKILLALSLLITICIEVFAQDNIKPTNSSPVLNFIGGAQFVKPQSLASIKPAGIADTTRLFSDQVKYGLKQTFSVALETFLPFQFKYAILLNESVEKLTNVMLYKTIDEWYGTHYRYGGSTERGIDCSAFMQILSGYVFGQMLPRTAREQYASLESISKDDLKEGDFVFFNTTGGISHVGMYLQNNKFVHSSCSQGVCIGDLDDPYWNSRFKGAKRIPKNGDFKGFPSFN